MPDSTATFGIETISITRPDSVEKYAKRLEGDKEVCRYLGELFPKKFPFNEYEWDAFAKDRLMAQAFEVGNLRQRSNTGELKKEVLSAFARKIEFCLKCIEL